MAATISFYQEPYTYNPINAPAWIVAYSDDYSIQDFRYVYNLYTYEETNNASYSFVGQYKIPPRPDGTGVFDVHKVIKSSTNTDISPSIGQLMDSSLTLQPMPTDGVVKFRYKYGFQYFLGLTFASTYAYSVGGTDYVAMSFPIDYTPYVYVNDIITVQMSPYSSNQNYNGQALVLGSINNYNLYTNIPFGVTESNVQGQIQDLLRIFGTSSYRWAINGTRQYYDPAINNFTNQRGLTDLYRDRDLIFDTCTQSHFIFNWSTEGTPGITMGAYNLLELTDETASILSLSTNTDQYPPLLSYVSGDGVHSITTSTSHRNAGTVSRIWVRDTRDSYPGSYSITYASVSVKHNGNLVFATAGTTFSFGAYQVQKLTISGTSTGSQSTIRFIGTASLGHFTPFYYQRGDTIEVNLLDRITDGSTTTSTTTTTTTTAGTTTTSTTTTTTTTVGYVAFTGTGGSPGLYPVTSPYGNVTGTIYNNFGSFVYLYVLFNSGGVSSGYVSDYAIFDVGGTNAVIYTTGTITTYGQNIVSTSYYTLSATTTINASLYKSDNYSSGSVLRFAYSLTPGGTLYNVS